MKSLRQDDWYVYKNGEKIIRSIFPLSHRENGDKHRKNKIRIYWHISHMYVLCKQSCIFGEILAMSVNRDPCSNWCTKLSTGERSLCSSCRLQTCWVARASSLRAASTTINNYTWCNDASAPISAFRVYIRALLHNFGGLSDITHTNVQGQNRIFLLTRVNIW